jgi:hypothetical protein
MIDALILANASLGYQRLVGEYRGPMFFHDQGDGKEKQFTIDMRIVADSDGSTWKGLNEKLSFKLTGWNDFCQKKTDWFEIERTMINSFGVQQFRRRFTIKPNGDLWSEKWVKPKDKEWEFSHRMELKRMAK